MKDNFNLVFAQHTFQQIGAAQAAAHHVDAIRQSPVHKFAGGNPVAYQRRHGRTLLQQVLRQPSAHQPSGAGDKDGTVTPEAVFHSFQTFQGAWFALHNWFKYSYSRYVSIAKKNPSCLYAMSSPSRANCSRGSCSRIQSSPPR